MDSAALRRFGRFDEAARRTALKRVQNPGQGPGGSSGRAGLGLMSTQRRANRTFPAIETDRVDVRRRWFRGSRERAGISVSAVRPGSLLASYTTAPLMSIFWLAWAWFTTPAARICRRGPRCLCRDERSQASTLRMATNSLPSDYRFETFAGHESLSSSPPQVGAGGRGFTVPPGTHRSSPPHIPSLPVRTHLHPTLPKAPAGEVRWAERHDGKRDLYFQHAA